MRRKRKVLGAEVRGTGLKLPKGIQQAVLGSLHRFCENYERWFIKQIALIFNFITPKSLLYSKEKALDQVTPNLTKAFLEYQRYQRTDQLKTKRTEDKIRSFTVHCKMRHFRGAFLLISIYYIFFRISFQLHLPKEVLLSWG